MSIEFMEPSNPFETGSEPLKYEDFDFLCEEEEEEEEEEGGNRKKKLKKMSDEIKIMKENRKNMKDIFNGLKEQEDAALRRAYEENKLKFLSLKKKQVGLMKKLEEKIREEEKKLKDEQKIICCGQDVCEVMEKIENWEGGRDNWWKDRMELLDDGNQSNNTLRLGMLVCEGEKLDKVRDLEASKLLLDCLVNHKYMDGITSKRIFEKDETSYNAFKIVKKLVGMTFSQKKIEAPPVNSSSSSSSSSSPSSSSSSSSSSSNSSSGGSSSSNQVFPGWFENLDEVGRRELIAMTTQAVSHYGGVTPKVSKDITTNSETLVGFNLTEEQVKEMIQMLYGQRNTKKINKTTKNSESEWEKIRLKSENEKSKKSETISPSKSDGTLVEDLKLFGMRVNNNGVFTSKYAKGESVTMLVEAIMKDELRLSQFGIYERTADKFQYVSSPQNIFADAGSTCLSYLLNAAVVERFNEMGGSSVDRHNMFDHVDGKLFLLVPTSIMSSNCVYEVPLGELVQPVTKDAGMKARSKAVSKAASTAHPQATSPYRLQVYPYNESSALYPTEGRELGYNFPRNRTDSVVKTMNELLVYVKSNYVMKLALKYSDVTYQRMYATLQVRDQKLNVDNIRLTQTRQELQQAVDYHRVKGSSGKKRPISGKKRPSTTVSEPSVQKRKISRKISL